MTTFGPSREGHDPGEDDLAGPDRPDEPGTAEPAQPRDEPGELMAAGPSDQDEVVAPEVLDAGFTHRYGGTGTGFAAGGPLDVMLPGPDLAWHIGQARQRGLGMLSDDELCGVVSAARRLSSWQAELELAAIAELDTRRAAPDGRGGEHVAEEVAAALTLTGRSAGNLLELSRRLERLPQTQALLAAGVIDRSRAAVIADQLSLLADADAADVENAIAPRAGGMTTGRLAAACQHAVLAHDPLAADRRKKKAEKDARVECWAEPSGTGAIAGRDLNLAAVIAADKHLDAAARWLQRHGVPGTMDQLRAQAFLARLAGQPLETLLPRPAAGPTDPGPPAPASAGLIGTVNLVMPATAWLGLAARLAAQPASRWCLTLTDRNGRAVAHGCARDGPGPPSTVVDPRSWLAQITVATLESGTCAHRREAAAYRPPGSLRHLIKIRDRRCGYPGCRRPAARCDDDHTIPHHQGGRTCECNLYPLCRRHHQAKQAPGWHLSQPEPGVLTWTTPSGRRYTVTPEPYPR